MAKHHAELLFGTDHCVRNIQSARADVNILPVLYGLWTNCVILWERWRQRSFAVRNTEQIFLSACSHDFALGRPIRLLDGRNIPDRLKQVDAQPIVGCSSVPARHHESLERSAVLAHRGRKTQLLQQSWSQNRRAILQGRVRGRHATRRLLPAAQLPRLSGQKHSCLEQQKMLQYKRRCSRPQHTTSQAAYQFQ